MRSLQTKLACIVLLCAAIKASPKSTAKFHPRKVSPKPKTHVMNADASPKANYKIAGIGKAQDPSTVYNWNWARDFGGTVDAVTISF